ncbi:MAG TPA: YeeE/YedE thiosulfate transporter family protein [Gemmatales bacterium]|mgnify:CR=1 FL=1|nr:YeeE/YedE thiosulfate transporter family protein [Gemmatales bacterium]HMP61101.1 YeeE/YedE thiosulfate transporter family protein [Gemmatales bacterium]
MVESWPALGWGLLAGFLFGFLLQKGGVTRYEVIVNMFRLKDFTVLKIMLTAIVVGGLGVFFLHDQGLAKLSVKPAWLLANVGGGLIFGVGMVLLGLCPGTAVAALGEGNRRAAFGVLGMLLGAWLQAESYGWCSGLVRQVDLGAATVHSLLGVSPWLPLGAIAAGALVLFLLIEAWERSRTGTSPGPQDLPR